MPFTKIDIVKAKVIFFTIFIIVGTLLLHAQPTPRGQPDVSNKTLITNANQDHVMGAAALQRLLQLAEPERPGLKQQRRPPHLG
jgi:hypothetical protein